MKAILVLPEMPGGCVECTLARMNADGEMICAATEKEANFIIGVDKLGSCPLCLMPNEIPSRDGMIENKYKDGYRDGWNDCIQMIERNREDV